LFEAEFAGYLPELKAYEDYLTSCVFGALKYLPPNKGLLPVLAAATNHRLDISLEGHCEREGIQLGGISEARFIFWPRCSGPRPSVPDLVVILQGGSHSFIVPIEVKYFAGKHGEEEDDQLVRYYQVMRTAGAREAFGDDRIRRFSGELLGVVYVTQFAAKHEIEAALHQLESEGRTEAYKRVFHLRWQHVYRVTRQLLRSTDDTYQERILADIARLLEHKHLKPFAGFSKLPSELFTEVLLQRPVFLESSGGSADRFLGFSPLPSELSREELSQRPVFLHPRSQLD
jgi:hypothetical protein